MPYPVDVHPHHVAIFTSDLDRSVTWWEEMFGFAKMFENVFFSPDYGNARMACTKHVSLYVDEGQFDTVRDYLKGKSVPVVVEAEHPGEKLNRPGSCKVMFVLDPDGTSVEIQETFTSGEYGR